MIAPKKLVAADLFCGAGGSSSGVEQACEVLGIPLELTAINHWPRAVETHEANFAQGRHFCASLDSLNPRDLYAPGDLDLLWASPECTHHSVARGGRPIQDQSRATAWCVVRWAEALQPRIIAVENVPEFKGWGPLDENLRPVKSRKGEIYNQWKASIASCGYTVEEKVLVAADYGAATTRRRLFVIARRDPETPVWPESTHSKDGKSGGKWRPARDVIDWSLKGESIYRRKRPLAEKTVKRIYAGLERYGLKSFIVAWDHQSSTKGTWAPDEPLSTISTKARHGVCEPYLVKLRGSSEAHIRSSGQDINSPCPVVTAGGQHLGLAEPMLLPQQSKSAARTVEMPVPTVATKGCIGLIEPILVEYYGNGKARSVEAPLGTVTTRDRFALAQPVVQMNGEKYILDILFRMLQPHELAQAQGFPLDYVFTGNKTETVKQIGNAVPPEFSKALTLSNLTGATDISQWQAIP